MNAKFLPLLGCLLLSACAVGEDYQLPQLGLDSAWQALTKGNGKPDTPPPPDVKTTGVNVIQSNTASSTVWWERFRDARLSQLMEKAKTDNHDLKVALSRIAEARGNARIAGAAPLPQVNASGSVGRTGALRSTASPPDTVKQFGLSASWDIDIFGGDQRGIEAALAEVQATEADKDKVLLSLLSDVASNYIQMRSLQQQRIQIVRNLDMQNNSLRVTLGQRKEGAISDLEVARAKAQVSGTAARLPQIDTATIAAFNRISVLTGAAPTMLNQELAKPQQVPIVPAEVVVATPVQALQRRPDVQAAERRLAEATALTGVAIAQLYPKVSIQAFFGSQFSQVYGYSTPVNATASALMPLIEWGRIHGQIDAADARQQQAFETYQQTVLLALEQIENALTGYINEQKRQKTLEAGVQQQRKATEVAREQYKVGATTQLDLLTAESNQLDAENELIQSRAALGIDLIQLYTALGETWQATQPEHPPAIAAKPVVAPAAASATVAPAPVPMAEAKPPLSAKAKRIAAKKAAALAKTQKPVAAPAPEAVAVAKDAKPTGSGEEMATASNFNQSSTRVPATTETAGDQKDWTNVDLVGWTGL